MNKGRMNEDSEKVELVKKTVEKWAGEQGHNQCWYYPEVLREIATIVDARTNIEPNLPQLNEFLGREGCRRYAMEIFNISPEFPEYMI